MGKNKIINKEKRQYHKLQKVITIVIISVLVVICSVSYIRKKIMLNESGVTTCTIIDIQNESGSSSGLQAKIYYYVNGIKFTSYNLLPSRKYSVGEKYQLKYSIKDPSTYEIIWDERILGDSVPIRFEGANREMDE